MEGPGNYLDYLSRLQQQPGWFDLLRVVIRMMARNAPPVTCRAFLEDAGRQLAMQYPLPSCATLGALNDAVNSCLTQFRWGYAQISDQQTCLVIDHFCMPLDRGDSEPQGWLEGFAAVLCGLYDDWFHQTGAPYTIGCRLIGVSGDARAQFRLEKLR